MTRKRIRELTNLASLGSGGYSFAVDPPSAGDARKVLDTVMRTFMTADVNTALATHLADTQAHGISAFVSSLLSAEDLPTLLALLGFIMSGDGGSGSFSFGGLAMLTWRRFTTSANGVTVHPYGLDHVYTSFAEAWCAGDDANGDVSTSCTSAELDSAHIYSHSSATVNVTLIAFGV